MSCRIKQMRPLQFPALHRVRCPVMIQRNTDGDTLECRMLLEEIPDEDRPLSLIASDGMVERGEERDPWEPGPMLFWFSILILTFFVAAVSAIFAVRASR